MERLNIDWADAVIVARKHLLGLINGATLVLPGAGDPYIRLEAALESYSTGEQVVIKFVQSPQMPLSLHLLDGDLARVALETHTDFWRWRLYR